jgi:hypothetical protein
LLTFHADDSLASVKRDVTSLLEDLCDSRSNKLVQLVAEWVSEHRMNDQTLAPEESLLSDTFGPVDDLVWNDKVPWSDLLPERADGGKGNNGLDANMLQSGNVGSSRHLSWCDGVGDTMSGDESDERTGGESRDGDRG